MCFGAVLGFGKQSPEKVTRYLTDGFLFAIRIFAPVIVIGAFFFLGGGGITSILGEGFGDGILNDWAVWLAAHTPLNPYIAAFFQLIIGCLTGLDGSGFSGLPLTGALAHTFGTATFCSRPGRSRTDWRHLCRRRHHRSLGTDSSGSHLQCKPD